MSYAMEKELHQGWKLLLVDDADWKGEIRTAAELNAFGTPMDAQVPGEWPLDYVREGLLDDPFFGSNYLQLRPYENSHVCYTTRFAWDGEAGAQAFLRFEGVDTVADFYLNGECIGHSENMFIPHEFAISPIPGENELLVHLSPVVLEARKYPIGAFNSMLKYNYESLVIRKAAHTFGWDICPRVVSAGLWRPVKLLCKKPARIENIYTWIGKLRDDGSAECTLSFDVDIGREPIAPYELKVEGVCKDSRFSVSQKLWYVHGRMSFTLEDPQLWWVRGYGDPNQYDITATLMKNGEAVDVYRIRQGLRTISLVYDDYITGDSEAEFCFILNGKRIFIKGTNWVPADAFHSNDVNRIPAILELVKDIGCNGLRIWGGGVYESDAFYDWCDENGIFIWHDFMMACGIYPDTQRMRDQLEEEATAMVRRLRHHASICLWAGDNECDIARNWMGARPIDPNLNTLTRVVLPRVLNAEDPIRPYLPSSPYISPASFRDQRFQATPEQHLWGPRDYFKGHFYHDHLATFASEMGYHGCNSPDSIRKFIPQDKLWPPQDNDMWFYHAASPETENSPYTYRIPLMTGQVNFLWQQRPEDLDTYARMSQISQAEAKKYFVESFRAHKGVRTGLIWWNIMDNWPQFSDAVVDYYFCRKLAYFYIRRSQQPLCLMMDDKSKQLVLYAVNDHQHDCAITFRVYDLCSGDELVSAASTAKADASTPLFTVRDDGGVHFYVIEWECGGEKGLNHYLQGKPPYDYEWYMSCIRKLGLDEFEGFGGTDA